jgi:hypothetical protein
MSAVSPIVPAATATGARDQQQRAPVDYGAAVTHRDMVREKMRVDPTSLAAKKRASPEVRQNDQRKGRYVDIET